MRVKNTPGNLRGEKYSSYLKEVKNIPVTLKETQILPVP